MSPYSVGGVGGGGEAAHVDLFFGDEMYAPTDKWVCNCTVWVEGSFSLEKAWCLVCCKFPGTSIAAKHWYGFSFSVSVNYLILF